MSAAFQLALEHIGGDEHSQVFRLVFRGSKDRLLLPYPEVTGLEFAKPTGEKLAEWMTRFLVSGEPLDEFVLRPNLRIAFDLKADINIESDSERRWTVALPKGRICAQYLLDAKPDMERWELRVKGSRVPATAKPWCGLVKSNVVEFTAT
jgi:hypothetical protein